MTVVRGEFVAGKGGPCSVPDGAVVVGTRRPVARCDLPIRAPPVAQPGAGFWSARRRFFSCTLRLMPLPSPPRLSWI